MALARCSLCKLTTMSVIQFKTIEGGTMLIGRCLHCDTGKCPNCEGFTAEPTKTNCKHCNHPLTLEAK